GRQPMFIITGAVISLAAIVGSLQLIGERSRPFLPGEMSLLGELDRQRKRLRLPRLREHRAILLARKPWQRGKLIRLHRGIRLAQGSRPTYQDRRHPAAWPARPTARAPRSGPSRRAEASRRGNGRWCPGK